MEKNLGLALFKALRHGKGGPVTDQQARKATGLSQTEIDIAAEELEAEGMLIIERTYTLVEG
jgi:biotin operon repressor